MYSCSKCGLGVVVTVGGKPLDKPIRACNCNATIIAGMSSAIEGKSGMNVGGVSKLTEHREKPVIFGEAFDKDGERIDHRNDEFGHQDKYDRDGNLA